MNRADSPALARIRERIILANIAAHLRGPIGLVAPCPRCGMVMPDDGRFETCGECEE